MILLSSLSWWDLLKVAGSCLSNYLVTILCWRVGIDHYCPRCPGGIEPISGSAEPSPIIKIRPILYESTYKETGVYENNIRSNIFMHSIFINVKLANFHHTYIFCILLIQSENRKTKTRLPVFNALFPFSP